MLPTDRFPLITESGFRLLQRLQEHPHAPRYTHPGCNRLTPDGLRRAAAFAIEIQAAPPRWGPGQPPDWLAEFVERCYREVPFHRRYGGRPASFGDIPTTDRGDLGRAPWAFVPDPQPLDDLIVYNTSGTTGHPLDILTHADTLALYLPLLRAALAAHAITLESGPGRVAILLACYQKYTYTYAAVSAFLDQAGFVKVNLKPAEWRDPADRARFLDDCQPEVYTGDPIAFHELMALPLRTRPKALVSTAMTLSPGLKSSLASHFDCPVIDVYAMNESGPIAVRTAAGYALLQPRLFVEILTPQSEPCPPGVRGEVTLSGGFNPFLPLLRYRTGDHAALEFNGGQPVLVGLEGRPPVTFRAADGEPINNVDISIALRSFPITQYTLHQASDGALRLKLRAPDVDQAIIREALLGLFGPGRELTVESLETLGDKVIQYTSDFSNL